jgi:hypothetical protein
MVYIHTYIHTYPNLDVVSIMIIHDADRTSIIAVSNMPIDFTCHYQAVYPSLKTLGLQVNKSTP